MNPSRSRRQRDEPPANDGSLTLKLQVRVTADQRQALARRLEYDADLAGARAMTVAIERVVQKYLDELVKEG